MATAIHIVGCGLMGSSLALALAREGFRVTAEDTSDQALRLAKLRGIDCVRPKSAPRTVFVCTPPNALAKTVAKQLQLWPESGVFDIGSVKAQVLEQLGSMVTPDHLERYLGTHPMTGKETSGPLSASSEMFRGRAWIICPHSESLSQKALEDQARGIINLLGARPLTMSAQQHDRAAAVVSHLPQIVSSLVAERLADASEEALQISGPGLRDITRLAGSNSQLWLEIIAANSASIKVALEHFRRSLDQFLASLDRLDRAEARFEILNKLAAGRLQINRLPGKHGQKLELLDISILLEDEPGRLVELLSELSEAKINVEDLRLEHSPHRPEGTAVLTILAPQKGELITVLHKNQWTVMGTEEFDR